MLDPTIDARKRVRVIDSHTGGEPTGLVVGGAPHRGKGPLSARLQRFRREHDSFRSAVVNEPRGSGVMVGALLCEPTGSVFEGNVSVRDGNIYPSIKGSAFVNAESELVLDPLDPFCMGIT